MGFPPITPLNLKNQRPSFSTLGQNFEPKLRFVWRGRSPYGKKLGLFSVSIEGVFKQPSLAETRIMNSIGYFIYYCNMRLFYIYL